MAEKGKPFWCFALLLIVWVVSYQARPAPVLAGATISSDVISAAGGQASSSHFAIHDTFGQDPIGPVAVGSTIQLYDGFWSALAVAVADTTPPGALLTFEATPLDESVFLEWLVPVDADLSGTLIMYRTSGFPTGPSDGTPVENGASGRFPVGSGQSFTHAGLTNGATYYYAAFDYDASGNYSAALTDSATPFDGVAPGPLPAFSAEAGDTSVTLTWTNPADADFELTVIRYSTSGYPTSAAGGLPVDGADGEFPDAPGTSDQFVHTGLVNGTTYYYSAFAADEVPNYSIVSQAGATPGDVVPPAACPTLVATEMADGSVRLRFETPSDADVEGVLVRYAIGYPPSTIDAGLPVPNGNAGIFDAEPDQSQTFYHRGLVTDTTYFYSVWAFDEVPNYSARISVSARPHDETAPELALSVFQNPYLTQYLDIYLIGSEALTDTSVYCSVDGDEIAMELADADENVWMADYELDESGTISVYAMARDMSLNWAEVTHEFTSTLVLRAAGGTARSPDGRIEIDIPAGAFRHDTYVLVSEETDVPPEVAVAYKISPPGIEVDDFVEISIAYDEEYGPVEHLTLARFEDGAPTPVGSYVDREHGRLLAFVDEIGTYGLMWNPDEETPEYGAGQFTVLQNVPNPFAGITSIAFVLPRAGLVHADVVTIDGRMVTEICDRFMTPGRHSIDWDGRDGNGQRVASGVYFYRVRFGSETNTRKMVSLY
jgi:chitodextrinase